MDQATRDVLTGMKAELSKGWVQGDLRKKEGVCLYGAFATAADLPIVPCSPFDGGMSIEGRHNPMARQTYMFMLGTPAGRAISALAAEVGVTWQKLAVWNDAEGRTVDDITNAIDRLLLRDRPLKKNARKRMRRERELQLA